MGGSTTRTSVAHHTADKDNSSSSQPPASISLDLGDSPDSSQIVYPQELGTLDFGSIIISTGFGGMEAKWIRKQVRSRTLRRLFEQLSYIPMYQLYAVVAICVPLGLMYNVNFCSYFRLRLCCNGGADFTNQVPHLHHPVFRRNLCHFFPLQLSGMTSFCGLIPFLLHVEIMVYGCQ